MKELNESQIAQLKVYNSCIYHTPESFLAVDVALE